MNLLLIRTIGRFLWRHKAEVAIALVLAGLLYAIGEYGDRREAKGRAHVQAKWDADEAEEKRVADAATLKAQLQDAGDAARNEEIDRDYEAKLAAASSDLDRLGRLLRKAVAAAGAVPAGQGSGVPGATEAGPPPSPDGPDLSARIAALMVEARQNADQLDSLIAQITPQLQ